MIIDPISTPDWGTALSTARKSHVEERVDLARSELWPNGMPRELHVSERNRIYAKFFEARGWAPASDRHLQRLHGGR